MPHYDMLLKGLEKEFGFHPKLSVRRATEAFLAEFERLMDTAPTAKVVGAIYALESSANPELRIVRNLFEALAEKEGHPLAARDELSLIWLIEIHTDTDEVDHDLIIYIVLFCQSLELLLLLRIQPIGRREPRAASDMRRRAR